MKTENKGLLYIIGKHVDSFSLKQRTIAKYVIDNYLDLAYLTISQFAQKVGVSDATVVRFVYSLGFTGFADFMAALRSEIENTKTNSLGSMSKHSWESEKYKFPRDVMHAIFSLEISIMEELLIKMPNEIFHKAVDEIESASQLLIVGCGASKCHTQEASFAFNVLKANVRIIENLDLSTRNLVESIPPKTTCIVFSVPRYPRETQAILECMKDGKNKPFIIGVTDSLLSPVVPYSNLVLQVPQKFVIFVNTNAAYMALIHAMAFALYLRNIEYSKKRIEEYDAYVKKNKFYVWEHLDLIKF